MSTAYELSERERRVRWCIEFAGLRYRYTSGGTWPSKAWPSVSGSLNYIDVPAIEKVGALAARITPTDGAAEYDPIEVSLVSHVEAPWSAGDPAMQLCLVSDRAATFSARVLNTLHAETSPTLTTTIEVDEDPTGLSFPRQVHVGQECINVTGAAGAGTTGDPWRFTGLTRGAGGSVIQRHITDSRSGILPRLTTPEKVNWEGCRVVIYVANERDTGGLSTPIEFMRGFVSEAPRRRGGRVTFSVAPLTAKLDVELAGDDAAFGLLQGFHRFVGGRAVVAGQHAEVVRAGEAFRVPQGFSQSTVNGTRVYGNTAPWLDIYDKDLDPGHPRRGRIVVPGLTQSMEPSDADVTGTNEPYWITPAGTPSATVPGWAISNTAADTYTVENVDHGEGFEIDLAGREADDDDVVLWPDALKDAWSTAWTPSACQGADGKLIDMVLQLETGGGRGPHIECSLNSAKFAIGVHLLLGIGEFHRNQTGYPTAPGTLVEIERFVPTGVDDHTVRSSMARGFALLDREALDLSDPATGEVRRDYLIRAGFNSNEGVVERVPIVGAATAFYCRGEQGFLVDKTVTVPAGGSLDLEITYEGRGLPEEPDGDEIRERTVTVTVVSASSVSYGGSPIGTWLQLAEADWREARIPSFADWPSRRPVEIRPVVRFAAQFTDVLMTQLLQSDAGEQVRGTRDTLPYGCGLTADELDAPSFLLYDDPPGFQAWTLRFPDGSPVRKVIDPMLLATGTMLAMRRDSQGRCRLTRVPVGAEAAAEALGTITDADLLDIPDDDADFDVVSLIEVRTDWTDGDKPLLTTPFINPDARNATGRAKPMEIDLRGLRMPRGGRASALQTLRGLVGRLFQQFGRPRRVWRVRVDAGAGFLAQIGGVYLVTSRFLTGYSKLPGVTAVPARVVDMALDLEAGVCDLVLVHYGQNQVGWNESAQVTSTPASDQVVVAANAYCPTEHPITRASQQDLDGFNVGDVVDAIPVGNEDGATTGLTITAIDRGTRTITFDGAHGLSGSGDIEPSAYDDSNAAHKALAYVADANGRLGAANDQGFDVA